MRTGVGEEWGSRGLSSGRWIPSESLERVRAETFYQMRAWLSIRERPGVPHPPTYEAVIP